MAPQVTLLSHGTTPNPLKIAILLELLKVDYVVVEKDFNDGPNGVKGADFLKINPNGRVPAIIDHTNNDHVVWESGAILLYLAERFDPTGKYSGRTLEERSEVWQWLIFHVSGIGPIQGQVVWFTHLHPVKDLHPSVLERYQNETYRVWGVLEKQLAEQGEWVALQRFTVADIANYGWLDRAEFAKLDLAKFPHLNAYYKKIQALPPVKQAYLKLSPPK